MTDFIWHGPFTGLSIPDDKGGVLWDGIAAPGKALKGLPAEHPRVTALIACGYLKPAPASEPAAQPAPKRTLAKETT